MSAPATAHALAAEKLLADGEWHDGLELIAVIEKEIPPGIAVRKAELNRASRSARRNGQALPRKVERPVAAQIRSGKRSIITAMLGHRITEQIWEITPWPLPPGGYTRGGWQVRSLRGRRINLTQLTKDYGIPSRLGRELIMQDPPLQHRSNGRHLILLRESLVDFEMRLKAHREGESERRSRAMIAARRVQRVLKYIEGTNAVE